MQIDNEVFLRYLRDAGLVGVDEISDVYSYIDKEHVSAVDAVVALGILGDSHVRKISAHLLGVPYIDHVKKIPLNILSMIPEPIARSHNVIATDFNQQTGEIVVALTDVGNIQHLDFLKHAQHSPKHGFGMYVDGINQEYGDGSHLEHIGPLRVLPTLADPMVIKKALLEYQQKLRSLYLESLKHTLDKTDNSPKDALISHALLLDASDIHIEPHEHGGHKVSYRIHGDLHEAMRLTAHVAEALTRDIKKHAGITSDVTKAPSKGDSGKGSRKQDDVFQYGAFTHLLKRASTKVQSHSEYFADAKKHEQVTCHVHILPHVEGETITIKVVRDNQSPFSLHSLGMNGDEQHSVHTAFARGGLIMLVGPEQSGITTAGYSLMETAYLPHKHMVTLEKEREAKLPHITQTVVRSKDGVRKTDMLRTLVQSQPHSIFIGDIFDEKKVVTVDDTEIATLLLRTSLSGAQVIIAAHTDNADFFSADTTMHERVDTRENKNSNIRASRAIQGIVRMKQVMGKQFDPFVLASSITMSIGHVLVPRTNKQHTYILNDKEMARITQHTRTDVVLQLLKKHSIISAKTTLENAPLYTSSSNEVLYQIREIMLFSREMKTMLIENQPLHIIERVAKAAGMLTLEEHMLYAALAGYIGIDTLLSYIS